MSDYSYIEEQDFDQKVDLNIWKKLFAYAMRYKKTVIAACLSMVFCAGMDIVYPLLTRYAINEFVGKSTTEGIHWFILIYAAVIIVQAICVCLFVRLAGKIEMGMAYDIRQEGFVKLQELSFSYYDKTPVGYIMARMVSDIARLSEMIAWSIVDLLWALTYMLGVVCVIFVLNWKLALITMVVIPPLAFICVYFRKKILKYQRVVRKTNSRITGAFNEGIMGAMTTKTLVREERNSTEFEDITSEMKRASVRSIVLSHTFMPLVILLGSVGTALALYYGGNAVLLETLGETTIFGIVGFGTLSAFISYTAGFFEPIQSLARILAEFQSAQASAERVLTLINTPCDVQDTPEAEEKYGDSFNPKRENWEDISGDIEFRHVSFAYKEGERVLDDFNLHVRAGENIALVGETGAGKSTIVNLVCRFYEPTEGEILIDGEDYRKRSQLWLQNRLGYVLQQPHLFSGTIRDNIAYARKDATFEEIRAAAQTVHAEEFILKQDKGYDTEIGEGGIRLSTGQKQLISFARVILADPRIFVLDEATSSIDTETEQIIQNATNMVLKGRTSFIVAHRLSTIKNADRILVIRNGKITECGTHSELLKLRGYYYDLYTTQFREEASRGILNEAK
ncbi:MAG: ABC transporter ATP-binding protein [Clostridia bacterium]|nr:ABC transporter ATP-binding protein [Clostridia bacterium]